MAVKIRLSRRGRKKLALFDIVAADSRYSRDGRFIEKLGTFNPNNNPGTLVLNEERALYWLMTGAEPTDTAKGILSRQGLMFKKHLQVGVNKGAITQEVADKRYNEWKSAKDAKVAKEATSKISKVEAEKKAKLAAEAKVKEARVEKIRQKAAAAQKAAEAPAEEAAASAE